MVPALLISAGFVYLVWGASHARSGLCGEERKTRSVVRLLLVDAEDSTFAETVKRLPAKDRPPLIRALRRDATDNGMVDVVPAGLTVQQVVQLNEALAFFDRNLGRLDALAC